MLGGNACEWTQDDGARTYWPDPALYVRAWTWPAEALVLSLVFKSIKFHHHCGRSVEQFASSESLRSSHDALSGRGWEDMKLDIVVYIMPRKAAFTVDYLPVFTVVTVQWIERLGSSWRSSDIWCRPENNLHVIFFDHGSCCTLNWGILQIEM